MLEETPAPKNKGGRPRGSRTIRPESERTPEPTPKLTAEEQAKIAGITEDALFLTSDEILCVHLSMRKNRESAASRLGWTMDAVMKCLAQPHVKLYAIEYREKFIKTMVDKEVAEHRRAGVTKATVQQRLMDLAMMSPHETKGSIEGQVKALTELSAQLALKKDDPLGNKTTEELMEIVNTTRAEIGKPSVQ